MAKPLTREQVRLNKRIVSQVRYQMRYTATREQGFRNIDRMMRDNRAAGL